MIFLLLLLSSSLVACQSIGETIGFQIHSYDDVAEWPSVFAKGAAHLKIDPQYRGHAFCRNQTRDRSHDKRGCFVLNHDDAGGRNDYNTGDDVVAFFNDSRNAPLLASPVLVQFALCFKYIESKPLCDNADWLGLADDWIAALLGVIRAQRLNLELVLDGSASPDAHRKCLWNRWRPLNVTWTLPGDPPGAFFDNNATEAHDRYQILNVPAYEGPLSTQAWRLAALAGFGKFAQQTRYDFQVWEPSNASDIASVLSVYTSTKILHRNMRMAINIDPVQFQLAAAPVSGTATAAVVAAMPTATDSRVSLAAIDHRLVMFRVSAAPPGVQFVVLDDTKTPYNFASPSAATTLPLAIGELRGVGCVGGYCWLADNQSFAIVAPLSAQPMVASGALPSPAAVSASTAFESPRGGVVVRARSDASCALALQLFDLAQGTFKVAFDLCLYSKFAAGFTAASLAVAATFDDASARSLTALVALGDTDTVIRYTTVTIDYQQSTGAWAVDAASLGALAPAGVGSTPSVAIARSPATNQTVAILVHNDAYAWNCEAYNKRPTPALCQSTPVSTPGVSAYTYGLLSSFAARSLAQAPLTPCDAELLHGSHGQSALAPTVAVLPTAAGVTLPRYPCGPICTDVSLRIAVAAVGGSPAPPQCGTDAHTPSGAALLRVWAPPTLQ
jgi:hypothetical protein